MYIRISEVKYDVQFFFSLTLRIYRERTIAQSAHNVMFARMDE